MLALIHIPGEQRLEDSKVREDLGPWGSSQEADVEWKRLRKKVSGRKTSMSVALLTVPAAKAVRDLQAVHPQPDCLARTPSSLKLNFPVRGL